MNKLIRMNGGQHIRQMEIKNKNKKSKLIKKEYQEIIIVKKENVYITE